MRRQLSLLVIALLLSAAFPIAQSSSNENKLVGKWSGTFDGDASGTYSMAFERDAAKKLVGTLQTSPATGDGYTARFKTIAVDGPKVTLAYDSPNGEPIEIQIEAALEGTSLKGTWKVIEAASKNVSQRGTLVGKKG